MSELQNENEVLVSEDVVSTTPATEESKDDDSLGKLGIALIGLAAVGTYTLGKAAVKGGMMLVEKVKEKRVDLKRFKDSKDADYREAEPEETDEDQDETENEK
ncbi:hypothetical protein [Segatella sp.]|uniref:hypothetical protein n=1 Tax=Segatella sp. TaxID=2974253 RepID=UPI003AB0B5A6